MTNLEALKRFDQTHAAKIDKLFWIAGSMDNEHFQDLLEELEDDDWLDLFPEIHDSEYFRQYLNDGESLQALVDFRKFGLVAEIHLPECDNFKYKEDKPVRWSVRGGCCRIEYIYAETLESLMDEIEKVSKDVFQEYVDKDRIDNGLAVS